ILENSRSRGVATEEAMVSALAPGSDALISIVGKSTSGSAATGRFTYASAPNSVIASITSMVATGRRMNGSESFIRRLRRGWLGAWLQHLHRAPVAQPYLPVGHHDVTWF